MIEGLSHLGSLTLNCLFPDKIISTDKIFLLELFRSNEIILKNLFGSNDFSLSFFALEDLLSQTSFHSYNAQLIGLLDMIAVLDKGTIVNIRGALFQHYILVGEGIDVIDKKQILRILKDLDLLYLNFEGIKSTNQDAINTIDFVELYLLNNCFVQMSNSKTGVLNVSVPYYYRAIKKLKIFKNSGPDYGALEKAFEEYTENFKFFPSSLSAFLSGLKLKNTGVSEIPKSGFSIENLLKDQVRLGIFGPLPFCPDASNTAIPRCFLEHFNQIVWHILIHRRRKWEVRFSKGIDQKMITLLGDLIVQFERIGNILESAGFVKKAFVEHLQNVLKDFFSELKSIPVTSFSPVLTMFFNTEPIILEYSVKGPKNFLSGEALLFLEQKKFDLAVSFFESYSMIEMDIKKFEELVINQVDPFVRDFIAHRFSLSATMKEIVNGHMKMSLYFLFFYQRPCDDPTRCYLSSPLHKRVTVFSNLISLLPGDSLRKCYQWIKAEIDVFGNNDGYSSYLSSRTRNALFCTTPTMIANFNIYINRL